MRPAAYFQISFLLGMHPGAQIIYSSGYSLSVRQSILFSCSVKRQFTVTQAIHLFRVTRRFPADALDLVPMENEPILRP